MKQRGIEKQFSEVHQGSFEGVVPHGMPARAPQTAVALSQCHKVKSCTLWFTSATMLLIHSTTSDFVCFCCGNKTPEVG